MVFFLVRILLTFTSHPPKDRKNTYLKIRQVFFLLGYQPRFYAKAEGNNFCYKYILTLIPTYHNYNLRKKNKIFAQTIARVKSPTFYDMKTIFLT